MFKNSEWKKVNFSDVVSINPRESLKKGTLAKKVTMSNITEHTKKIYSYDIEEYKSGPKFRQGDTLFARITPSLENGKTSKVNILEEDELGFGSTELIVMREKSGMTDGDFIYYLTRWDGIRGPAIKSMTGTSGRQRVQNSIFDDLLIELPPLEEQKLIANILSSLDDKIENNNAIIANLEEQAQTIFKSWFVDFEPFQEEEFVDSELGRIPRNWRIATLKEFFPVVTGKKNANIATENGKYPFFTCAQDISYTDDFSFDDHAILVAGNGDFNVKRFKGKFEAYQRTYVLIPSDENLTGLLYHLINHYLKNIISGYKGSVINYITKGMIENFEFPFPNKIEEVGIVDVFNTIEKKIAYTKRENIKLEEIRDTLLPKLMSGELRVEEAIEVE